MKWLTIPQIKRRSKTAKGALKVSYEHWCQLYDATAKELRAEYNSDLILNSHCGLCRYHSDKSMQNRKCGRCVFHSYCPQPVWGNASTALQHWYYKYKTGNWHSWKRACKAVRDKLGELQGT